MGGSSASDDFRFGGAGAKVRLAAGESGGALGAAKEAGVSAVLLLQRMDVVRGGSVMGDWTRKNRGRRRRAEHTQAFSPLFLREALGHCGATNGSEGEEWRDAWGRLSHRRPRIILQLLVLLTNTEKGPMMDAVIPAETGAGENRTYSTQQAGVMR